LGKALAAFISGLRDSNVVRYAAFRKVKSGNGDAVVASVMIYTVRGHE
jgi:hypothetical protein